jgi:hypothetical protein
MSMNLWHVGDAPSPLLLPPSVVPLSAFWSLPHAANVRLPVVTAKSVANIHARRCIDIASRATSRGKVPATRICHVFSVNRRGGLVGRVASVEDSVPQSSLGSPIDR